MAPRRKDRCGARFRRRNLEDEPHVPETQELGLTGLGEAFIEALKHDERFSDVFADPFGDKQEGPTAKA
jgi:DNA-binding HxlR family transcriptional regulator